jgi:putative peptide zinc metalloprotease protein
MSTARVDLGPLVLAPAPGLAVTRTLFRGEPRYVVSDPARAAHVALSVDAWSLFSALDGQRSLGQIVGALSQASRPVPDLTALAPLLTRLRDTGLAKAVSGDWPLPETQKAKPPAEAQLVYYRRELIELMPVMPQVNALLGWLFTPVGVLLWAVLGLIAGLRLAGSWDEVVSPLAMLQQLSAAEAAMLFGMTMVIKAIHELSHATAYRRMAAAEGVPLSSIRAGVAFMLFLPFPFTNCTGAWAIADKRRRALIGAAGMYAESWIAILALLGWSLADDPLTRTVCLQIAMLVGLSTIVFNLNPLAKLDGYYVLTDLIERPNLQGQAQAAFVQQAVRTLRLRAPRPEAPERALLAYWAGSSAYRWVIFAGMFWLAYHVSPWLAVPVALIAISLLIVRPARNFIKALSAQTEQPERVKRGAWMVAGVLVAAAAFIPLPDGVRAPGLAEADPGAFVYAPRDARVLAVAAPGAQGAVLRLEDPELPLRQAELTARRNLALVQFRQMLDINPVAARAMAEEIDGLERQLTALAEEENRLAVSAGPGSRWDPLATRERAGGWITSGDAQPIGMLRPDAGLSVRALVEERAAQDLAVGQSAQVRVRGSAPLSGTIRRIDSRASDQLPSQALGRSAGGSLALDPSDPRGRTTQQRFVSVWIALKGDQKTTFQHGQRLDVRIGQSPKPLLAQLALAIESALRREAPTA